MKINLNKPELPPIGENRGVVVDVLPTRVKYKNAKTHDAFKVVIELEAKRKNGKRFIIEKTYPLDGNGKTRLRAALKTWHGGKEISEAELENVDPEQEFITKSCLAPVSIAHEDGQAVPHVGALAPTDPAVTPSGEYVRKTEENGGAD